MTEPSPPDIYSGTSQALEFPKISFRRMAQLVWKTWPFMRPMLKHIIVLLLVGALQTIIVAGSLFIAGDIVTNKVLVGEKVQPFQAWAMGLDESYVKEELGPGTDDQAEEPDDVESEQSGGLLATIAALAGIEPVEDEDEEDEEGEEGEVEEGDAQVNKLTEEQRKVVRDRMIVLLIFLCLLGAVMYGVVLPYYGRWVWHNVNQNLRVAMIERAEHLSLRYHSNTRVGDAIFRVYQDSGVIINLLEEGIIGPVVTIYNLVLGLIFIAFFDPLVALTCILILVPVVLLVYLFTPRIRRRSLVNRRAYSDLTSRLQESFSALKVVKVNRAESQILDRFNTDSERALDAALALRLEMVLLGVLVAFVGGAAWLGLEYVMVKWVIEDRETYLGAMVVAFIGFTVWNLGAFHTANSRVEDTAEATRMLTGVWARLQDLFIALERAFFLLDLKPEVADSDNPGDFPESIRQISWRNVHFAYTDQQILSGVNLTAQVGTVTAIVGQTGAGKSTLMSMPLRLYDPDEGSVLIDEEDLRDLRIDDIRHNTAIALQRNVLFAATIAENIRYSSVDASREDIEAAARVACADEFIRALPGGYDTELGERGGKLSTGQRQRLSIARAVVRDTPILILDEPTASLDAATEHQVLANLGQWGRDKVMFIITHRLSTIRNADQIAFLDDGQIVEIGTHAELLAREDGFYRKFVEAETSGKETS